MVTGSFAANYYAVPRMTRDIDLVVELSGGDADRFCALFEGDFYLDRDAVRAAIASRGAFNLIHVGQVDQVERAPASDGSAHRVPVEIKVALEQSAEPVGVPGRQLHDEVDVARHAWHRVVVGCERSGHHVRDPGGLEPSSDDRENLQLFGHAWPPPSPATSDREGHRWCRPQPDRSSPSWPHIQPKS